MIVWHTPDSSTQEVEAVEGLCTGKYEQKQHETYRSNLHKVGYPPGPLMDILQRTHNITCEVTAPLLPHSPTLYGLSLSHK